MYGKDTDVPGVAMPAEPEVGDQYRFEDVPKITTESSTSSTPRRSGNIVEYAPEGRSELVGCAGRRA